MDRHPICGKMDTQKQLNVPLHERPVPPAERGEVERLHAGAGVAGVRGREHVQRHRCGAQQEVFVER